MAEISEKQQPPVYPANPQGYPVNPGYPANPTQGYPANPGYPAGTPAPQVVNVLPQPVNAAVTGQQYRDQCK